MPASAPRPLRVLHLATHTGVAGGGAVQMARMAGGMLARGHHVACAFNWHDFRRGEGERNYADLEQYGVPYQTFRMEALFSKLLGDRRRFLKFVRDNDFQIVHVHKPRAMRFALSTFAPDAQSPAIVVQRGNCYPIDDYTRAMLNDRRVKAVVCVAEAVRQVVIEGGVEPSKVHVIYGGVPADAFDPSIDPLPVRRELDIPDAVPVVGIVANFDGKKAHPLFFEAAAQIAQRVPDVRFLVVGRGASEELPEHLQALGIADKVVLAGFRSDVPRMLAAMDVSVNVSNRGEGLTGAMRESLCMKKPVVCTNIGGNSELVRNGETGYLVPPNDLPAFVDAVVDLLLNPLEARRMADNGYKLVMEHFTEEVRIARLEKLYLDIVAALPSRR
ncbi:MAG TPA: glycosyltransferase family 4 protein [Abditibacteriaceae bacterium]